ncbi:aggregation-promoting factor C-terminal-like domain-containing protein [Kitasatospora mediocidica]|uniref:aggregation-promoting factor C-terminal-like domain-containing protein n=1 Tax=Kitasatospora mediocidica TaxID=58352 RepID=UPI002FBE78D1
MAVQDRHHPQRPGRLAEAVRPEQVRPDARPGLDLPRSAPHAVGLRPGRRAAAERPAQQAPAPAAPAAPAASAAPAAVAAPADNSASSLQALAASIVPADQLASFDQIITHESGWDVTATNPSSGAYGLPQALPGNKMASAGSDWQTNPATQIKWALSYMNATYGSPNQAWAFWQTHNAY